MSRVPRRPDAGNHESFKSSEKWVHTAWKQMKDLISQINCKEWFILECMDWLMKYFLKEEEYRWAGIKLLVLNIVSELVNFRE